MSSFVHPEWDARSAEMLHFARACWPGSVAGAQRLLALHIAIIRSLDDALEAATPLDTLSEEYQSVLPWRAGGLQPANPVHELRASIRTALVELQAGLASLARRRPVQIRPRAEGKPRNGAIRWWRRQARLTVAAMRQESLWRVSGSVPDEPSYLSVAQHSIAVDWLAASLWILDGATSAPHTDSPFLTATRAVAVAIRLANDLHDSERERREGKVRWLSVSAKALEANGWKPHRAAQRARQELENRTAQAAARALRSLDAEQWNDSPRLCIGLTGMLRAALDLYVPGLPAAHPAIRDALDAGSLATQVEQTL